MERNDRETRHAISRRANGGAHALTAREAYEACKRSRIRRGKRR